MEHFAVVPFVALFSLNEASKDILHTASCQRMAIHLSSSERF